MPFDTREGFGVDFNTPNQNVFCPFCEDPETSQSKSCSVHISGAFSCKSCGREGHVAEFYAQRKGISKAAARAALKIHSTLPLASPPPRGPKSTLTPELVDRTVANLATHKRFLDYLLNERGLTFDTLARFDIGCDEYRITIPVYENGAVRNIRRYMPHGKPKMVNHLQGDTTPCLYPLDVLEELEDGDVLIICEGEWDALIAYSKGFKAVTSTHGAETWSYQWTEIIAAVHDQVAFEVAVIFDVNDRKVSTQRKVKKQAYRIAESLIEKSVPVRVIDLPIEDIGGDITNYFVDHKYTTADLQTLIQQHSLVSSMECQECIAEIDAKPADDIDTVPGPTEDASLLLNLNTAGLAHYHNQVVQVGALVAGKRISPFIIPKRFTVHWTLDDIQYHEEIDLKPTDPIILQLLDCTAATQKSLLTSMAGVPRECRATITILESMNLEELYLIPTVDGEHRIPYTVRQAYYIGTDIETNRSMRFRGIMLAHPKTQQVTHLFDKCSEAETDLATFTLTPTDRNSLASIFQTEDVQSQLETIAEEFSQHVTHIYGRPDLHITVDLAFHSVLAFDFAGTRLRKGWLDVLIVGDTRTGKGFVTENLIKHFQCGELVSGEAVSLAGLVGGVQKIGDKWTLVWGRIPLNDQRLVAIDEAGAMTRDTIGKLSRIRSEGIAEITKIIAEKTTARTRLIWLANPRVSEGVSHTSKVLAAYNYGIEAVPDLIGAAEDVARFDMALIVAQSEVGAHEINKPHAVDGEPIFTTEWCRKLLLWTWSRTAEQVLFDDEVLPFIYTAATDLGKRFAAHICLIQGEDVRYKLARIAVAAAARTFSTDDGLCIRVKLHHAQFAYNFLYHIYSKPASGYLQLSMAHKERSTLKEPKEVTRILQTVGTAYEDLIDGLLEHRLLTARDIADYACIDIYQARQILSELVRARAIIKEGQSYVKKPVFKIFLTKLKAALAEHHYTENSNESPTEDQ